MKQAFRIPRDTLDAQALASDPALSAWVSANAGSGKTHVLASRVIRLLLKGTDPSRILCLTYTRAAAANMANRVFGNLAGWSLLPDEALADEVEKLEGRRPYRLASVVGMGLLLHCTAIGKAILAHLPPGEVDAVMASAGMAARTPATSSATLGRFTGFHIPYRKRSGKSIIPGVREGAGRAD
jgi:hypothetical protein